MVAQLQVPKKGKFIIELIDGLGIEIKIPFIAFIGIEIGTGLWAMGQNSEAVTSPNCSPS